MTEFKISTFINDSDVWVKQKEIKSMGYCSLRAYDVFNPAYAKIWGTMSAKLQLTDRVRDLQNRKQS